MGLEHHHPTMSTLWGVIDLDYTKLIIVGELLFTLGSPSERSVGEFFVYLAISILTFSRRVVVYLSVSLWTLSNLVVVYLTVSLWTVSRQVLVYLAVSLWRVSRWVVVDLAVSIWTVNWGYPLFSYAELEFLCWQFTMVLEKIVPNVWEFVFNWMRLFICLFKQLIVCREELPGFYFFVDRIAFCISSKHYGEVFVCYWVASMGWWIQNSNLWCGL